MLTARIAYFFMTFLIIVLNGAALLALWRANQTIDPVVPAALVLSLVGWPLTLSVAYGAGQAANLFAFSSSNQNVIDVERTHDI